jgi:uncharacterized protein (TIGR02421 family)
MGTYSAAQIDRLSNAAQLLLKAEERLPVLRTLSWNRNVADEFLSAGGRELPNPAYPTIARNQSSDFIQAARKLLDGDSPVHQWLQRFADITELTAVMLSTVGTPDFYRHSHTLYGGPSSPIADGERTALELARRLDTLLSDFDASVQLEPPEILSAAAVKKQLMESLPRHFGADAPRVEVTKNVSGKAAAGRDYIKLREDARFSDLDAVQLLQHEALVHIATGKNGEAQSKFPILAESYPGNARTQEGLAVFAEFISGALDPRRFKRLADRVIAIDMAAGGADFIDIYNFFRERSNLDAPLEAFESARRVMRGGVLTGGAPFTKDSVYLGGLLEVHNYLRAAVRAGDAEYIHLLFVGKIDLADLPAIKLMRSEGMISAPQFLPPWASDLRYLFSYLAYSTFLNQINLSAVTERYGALFGGAIPPKGKD